MPKSIDNIPFDKLTIRQLRTILFEFYNQDKPLIEILLKCCDKNNKEVSQEEHDYSIYLYNSLFNVNIDCPVCNEIVTRSIIDEENNHVRYYHEDTHFDYCCLIDLSTNQQPEDEEDE